ncbi:Cu2+-exporting ATPase [Novimethylophilus kurashikiensis]|uniref:P-type Cu(2+) transporter n=1 Tax=Novimethylophilus kurashikiensis TaxID=1825523 RepID=A0A2R5FHF1_9PROT|nr:heavy metal translocating P-type ATPase [Novimethylophilus kurashikiensis]GBG15541.1 Cu2+-exporting ATPase [Novimethylophilus kurashikiensis]
MDAVTTSCYHCGLPVPADTDFKITILEVPREMCCHGCMAVAESIVENGLDDYYRYRTEMPKTAEDLVPDELRKLDLYDLPDVQKSFVRAEGEHIKQASLILEGITCAACIWLNERHLKQLPGVKEANVNYASHRARVTWDEREIKLSTILAEIRKLGYQAHPFNAQQQESLRKQSRKIEFRRMAVAGLSTGQVMMLAVALYAGAAQGMEIATAALLRWFSLLMTVPAMLYSAVPFYQSAAMALRRKQVNMDVPIVLGLLAGFVGSLWATFRNEGVVYYDTLTMLIFLLLSTRFLERNAREKSVEAAENLLRLTPAMATKISDGQSEMVPVMDLLPGDFILAKPGETIAADGLVEEGASSVDESLLTGESRALPKSIGDKVVAGSINYESPLTIRVTEVGEDTVLAGIARLLDRAQAEKPRMAQTADQLAVWFTYVLLAIVVLAGLGWWYFNPAKIFDVVLSVLVVSCPCALSLAAPAAFAAAGSHLVKRGVLLTRGHALETLAKVTHVVFDKTGTLTEGKPALVAHHVYSEVDQAQCLRLAASLEQASEHPLAKSFLKAVEKYHLAAVDGAENLPGQGVAGFIEGIRYTLGNAALTPALTLPTVEGIPGATVVWLCDPRRVLAAFVLADAPRPQAAELIRTLKEQGVRVSMLSGDAPEAATWHAAALGIDQVFGGLSPDGKLNELMRMQASGEVIAMVGDGVNDAPVLAGAPVSIAMGSGTQMARASGDIVLLSENLMEIAHARYMSRFTMSVIHQNFIWSLAYNLIAVPVAVAGYLSPWLAALGMSVSSLIVVLNALRLR